MADATTLDFPDGRGGTAPAVERIAMSQVFVRPVRGGFAVQSATGAMLSPVYGSIAEAFAEADALLQSRLRRRGAHHHDSHAQHA